MDQLSDAEKILEKAEKDILIPPVKEEIPEEDEKYPEDYEAEMDKEYLDSFNDKKEEDDDGK